MGKAFGILVLVVFWVMIILGTILLIKDQRECHRRGGAFVKGFLTYECVGGR